MILPGRGGQGQDGSYGGHRGRSKLTTMTTMRPKETDQEKTNKEADCDGVVRFLTVNSVLRTSNYEKKSYTVAVAWMRHIPYDVKSKEKLNNLSWIHFLYLWNRE